ncbi:MAG: hypothetical protein KW804_00325 [Candidatus Doudnabacteria bacterium]|nr:hypothetical protein [Candidatus Doudnabacteria bacterium]
MKETEFNNENEIIGRDLIISESELQDLQTNGEVKIVLPRRDDHFILGQEMKLGLNFKDTAMAFLMDPDKAVRVQITTVESMEEKRGGQEQVAVTFKLKK